MSKLKIVLISMAGSLILAATSSAQTTNEYPLTVLETLEGATGQLVVKGTAPVSSLSIGSTVVSLVCKEDTLVSAGKKEYGVMLGIKSGQAEDRTIIDYDEMDSLLGAVDYLSKIDWSVTPLASFDASYTTRAGLRVAAFSSKRANGIVFVLRGSHSTKGISLTPDQVYQLYTLLAQGKTNLDALRTGQTPH
jgi:hypothetical protein